MASGESKTNPELTTGTNLEVIAAFFFFILFFSLTEFSKFWAKKILFTLSFIKKNKTDHVPLPVSSSLLARFTYRKITGRNKRQSGRQNIVLFGRPHRPKYSRTYVLTQLLDTFRDTNKLRAILIAVVELPCSSGSTSVCEYTQCLSE